MIRLDQNDGGAARLEKLQSRIAKWGRQRLGNGPNGGYDTQGLRIYDDAVGAGKGGLVGWLRRKSAKGEVDRLQQLRQATSVASGGFGVHDGDIRWLGNSKQPRASAGRAVGGVSR